MPASSARTEQGAKRMTGVVTRDSAQRRPSNKHRLDARDTYRHRRPLVSHQPDRRCRSVPGSEHPSPDPRTGRRRGHSAGCTNVALVHSFSTGIFTDVAPHSRLFSENATGVSNEATVASATAFEIGESHAQRHMGAATGAPCRTALWRDNQLQNAASCPDRHATQPDTGLPNVAGATAPRFLHGIRNWMSL